MINDNKIPDPAKAENGFLQVIGDSPITCQITFISFLK